MPEISSGTNTYIRDEETKALRDVIYLRSVLEREALPVMHISD